MAFAGRLPKSEVAEDEEDNYNRSNEPNEVVHLQPPFVMNRETDKNLRLPKPAMARKSTVGFGESQPAATNENPDGSDDPDGRQKNRRVEIVVEKR